MEENDTLYVLILKFSFMGLNVCYRLYIFMIFNLNYILLSVVYRFIYIYISLHI